jgi:penicillin-binding protein 1C
VSTSKKLLIGLGTILSAAVIVTSYLLPQILPIVGTITINDRNGNELMFLSENSERQKIAKLSQIPTTVIASTLAAEDKRFLNHHGIDWIATSRAMYTNIQSQAIVSGASTISQQVARNLLGTDRSRSVKNKLTDIILALALEKTYSKEAILQYYLNTIFYGNHTYGINAAAETYFATPVEKLDWNQATFLAAIPQNAGTLNPYKNLALVRNRQLNIAAQLHKLGTINDGEIQTILSQAPTLSPPAQIIEAPHFSYFVLGQLEQKYGKDFWHGHSVQVTTTLSRDWYRQNKQSLTVELARIKEKNAHNAAVLAIDNATGEILSYVGNTDYFDTANNGAVDMVQGQRQPGSALKPFIYLGTVLFHQLGTGSIFYDVPTSFLTAQNTPYTPLNYDLDYHGPVTMREALANSYNIPAVKALEKLGIAKGKQILHEAGIDSIQEEDDHYGLSLALGSAEVSLYQLTNAYRTLANQGTYSELQSVIAVTIDDQTTTWPQSPPRSQPTWQGPSTLITHILQDNKARLAEFGENNALEFTYPVAAKTGTSRNFNDNWTIGFTPQVTVGVWVGNSDGEPMKQVSGITGAGPIFHQVMDTINNHQNSAFKQLESLVATKICLPSGLLPQPLCTHTSEEFYLLGTEPKQIDTWYQQDGLHLPQELHYWQQRFQTKSIGGLTITTPQDQDVFLLDRETPLAAQKIKCTIHAPNVKKLTITLNQKVISSSTTCNLPLISGHYTLEVKGELDGKSVSDHVNYTIK